MIDPRALTDIGTWRAFAPRLTINDPALSARLSFLNLSPEQAHGARQMLKFEGYLQAGRVDWGVSVPLLADTVKALVRAGLSPVFAFVYDEFWIPFFKLHPLYQALLGPYRMLPACWVWHVDPKKNESGWKPHRDKGFEALFPDGTPKALTTWIALTPATPVNGCMYVVPANFDPNYGTAEDKQQSFDLDAVRALPADAGEFFIWNQAVLHWGSRCSPRASEPRISMAFEFQRADTEPYMHPPIEPLTQLRFEDRLRLIAKQMLQYQHMYSLDPAVADVMRDIVRGS